MRWVTLLCLLAACSPTAAVISGPHNDKPAAWEGIYTGENSEIGVELTLYTAPACSLRLWNGDEQAYSISCNYKWVSPDAMLLRVLMRYLPENTTDEHYLALQWRDQRPWWDDLELFRNE